MTRLDLVAFNRPGLVLRFEELGLDKSIEKGR